MQILSFVQKRSMNKYTQAELESRSVKILLAAGATPEVAHIVAEHLVTSNLCGVDSHGLMRLPRYIESILGESEDKVRPIEPAAEIAVSIDKDCVGSLDGGWGFGQPVALRAMTMAINKAHLHGIGAVGCTRCGHIGRLGAYSTMALEQDCIAIVIAKTFPMMVPYGGATRLLGNNPYSMGAPADEELPILVDFASTAAARGKILSKMAKGESLPDGWIVDSEGRASVDPQAFLAGGSLLPFGQHKGYSLAIMGELLGATLLGIGALTEYQGHNSALMLAINIEHFMPIDEFKQAVDRLIRKIKGSRIAEGFDEILLPGEPEARTKLRRLREGIPIDDKLMKQITRAGEKVGLEVPHEWR